MTNAITAVEGAKHRAWCGDECLQCEGGYHDDCTGMARTQECSCRPRVLTSIPCVCGCREPLTNNERHQLRKLIGAMSR